jgi:hypothetical protein
LPEAFGPANRRNLGIGMGQFFQNLGRDLSFRAIGIDQDGFSIFRNGYRPVTTKGPSTGRFAHLSLSAC